MSKKHIISTNRKIYHNFEVIETFEAGIVLTGSEVKSVRNFKVSLQDSYCQIEKGEIYICNLHIAPYEFSTTTKFNPKRKRKLLLHKHQINKLIGKLTQKGLTLVPSEVYFNERGFCKITICLVKSIKKYDKREKIKKREIEKEMRSY